MLEADRECLGILSCCMGGGGDRLPGRRAEKLFPFCIASGSEPQILDTGQKIKNF